MHGIREFHAHVYFDAATAGRARGVRDGARQVRGDDGAHAPEAGLIVREGMPHGFYFFPGVFSEGDEAFASIADFLKRTVG